MKKLTYLCLLLLSLQSFAQSDFNEKRITFVDFINLFELSCKIQVGQDIPQEDRTFTVLEKVLLSSTELLFKHELATASHCDLSTLDKLVQDSFTHFNHAEATITIIKRTGKSPRMVFEKCQRNYQEKIIIDFGQGTVLETSLLGKLIPAVGCR